MALNREAAMEPTAESDSLAMLSRDLLTEPQDSQDLDQEPMELLDLDQAQVLTGHLEFQAREAHPATADNTDLALLMASREEPQAHTANKEALRAHTASRDLHSAAEAEPIGSQDQAPTGQQPQDRASRAANLQPKEANQEAGTPPPTDHLHIDMEATSNDL